MTISLLLIGLIAKLAMPGSVHCGSGVGKPFDCCSKPNVLPSTVCLEKVREIAAGAGHPVLIKRARTLLVNSHSAAVKDWLWMGRSTPSEIAVTQDVGVRSWPTIVLGRTIEEGAGNLSGRIAGLNCSVVELRELNVAVAVHVGNDAMSSSRSMFEPLRCCREHSRFPGCCRR